MLIVNVSSTSPDSLERELSNFAARPFTFDDVYCGSMEGFLQSLKFPNQERQRFVARNVGYAAFKLGQGGNDWKKDQLLNWGGVAYPRNSAVYQALLDRAYDAQFDQSPALAPLLLQTVGRALRHTRGKHDSRDTVLTESEFVRQLERLRWRALGEVT